MKICLLFWIAFFLGSGFATAADLSDTALIKMYLEFLAKKHPHRTYNNVEQLNETADYINTVFSQYSDKVTIQKHQVNGYSFYENVICSFGPPDAKRIIIGAHYDDFVQPGADDDASGIVGLLELARLLSCENLKYRIDLVAYSLSEEPFLKSPNMGSYIHAKSLADQKAKVYGMVNLNMIGYFRKEQNTQKYPVGFFSMLYGTRGDFIGLVKKPGAGSFARIFCTRYKFIHTIKTIKISAPPSLLTIIYEDHMNYWKFGYSALMITDTEDYRNPNYHQLADTMETLDVESMAKVIDGVFLTLISM